MSDSAEYPVLIDGQIVPTSVPAMGGEGLVVPNVAALIFRDESHRDVLLQRRDKPGEVVRGLLEIPGGRWRAGESPIAALHREVSEETGLSIRIEDTASVHAEGTPGWPFVTSVPRMVVTGVEGSYPSLHVVYVCVAEGTPRPLPGETSDPSWWPLEDVVRELDVNPGGFVGQSYAVLTRYLDAGDRR